MSSSPVHLSAHRIPLPSGTRRIIHHSLLNPKQTLFFQSSISRVSSASEQKPRASCSPHCKKIGREVTPADFGEPSNDPSENERQTAKAFSSKELMKSLKRYGVAGVLSYGLLNTVYYLTTFLLVWFYFAPAPERMGYAAAVDRFLKIMAMVWAGSQVTKLMRAGGALALAPFVDKGLSWFTIRFKFESKGKAFAAIAGMCFGLALFLFLGLTLMSA